MELCSQKQEKEAELGQSLQEYEGLEQDKNCMENELNQLRNEHQEALAEKDTHVEEKRRAEARLAEVERAIFELLEDVQGPERAA